MLPPVGALARCRDAIEAYEEWLLEALIDAQRRYPAEERIVLLQPSDDELDGRCLDLDDADTDAVSKLTASTIEIAGRADLASQGPSDADMLSRLSRFLEAKEEGAFRAIRAMREELAAAQADLHQARAERDLIMSSASWKVTRPMRAFLNWWRG